MLTREHAETTVEDRMCQHGGGGRSITRRIAGTIRSLLDDLRSKVHIAIPEVDRPGNAHAILRDDRWRARDFDYHILT